MAIDFSKIFAQNGLLETPTDIEYLQGFLFLGSSPPTYKLFNYMFQNIDLKFQSLYQAQQSNYWTSLKSYSVGDIVYSATADSYKRFECVVAGTSGATEPTWTGIGTLVIDSSVTWIVDDVRDGLSVGSIDFSHVLKAGHIKANGTLISRAAYPRLWKFVSDNNLAVSEANWSSTYRGMYSVGDGSTTFRVPDLRGEFLRGLDEGRGVDSGRVSGSMQADEYKLHGHPTFIHTYSETTFQSYSSGSIPLGSGGAVYSAYTGTPDSTAGHQIGGSGGTETRPHNIALLACIKC